MANPLRGALALRARVLRRRFASPLEAVLLLVAAAIGWRLGAPWLAWVDVALLAVSLLAAGAAQRLLYGAPELTLLLPAGLDARRLVLLRGLELGALLTAALVPASALLAAAAGPAGLLALALAPGLTGAALLGGWALGRLGPRGRGLALGLGVAAVAAAVAAARGGQLGPVAAAGRDLAAGRPGPFVALAGGGLVCLALALVVAPLGHEAGLTRAALRDPGRRAPTWRWLARALGALGRQPAALLARDLALLRRGALPRAVVMIGVLPVVAGLVVAGARADARLGPTLLELVALLTVAIASAACGFLFALDLPRARRRQLVLERTLPLPGSRVALARTAGAALAALPVVAVVTALVALDPTRERAALAPVLALEALLLVLCVTHDAVGYGLRTECAGEPSAAAAYPVRAAPLVVGLALGLAVHPALVLLYPLLGYAGQARGAARKWERDAVEAERAGAA